MGPVCRAGAAVFPDLDSEDHVQAELGKVRKVFIRKAALSQVGMDEPESLKTPGMHPPALQFGDVDAPCIACDDIFNGTETVDEDADLDADPMRQACKFGGELVGYRKVRRNPPPVQPVEGSDLRCLQPFCISVDLQEKSPRESCMPSLRGLTEKRVGGDVERTDPLSSNAFNSGLLDEGCMHHHFSPVVHHLDQDLYPPFI